MSGFPWPKIEVILDFGRPRKAPGGPREAPGALRGPQEASSSFREASESLREAKQGSRRDQNGRVRVSQKMGFPGSISRIVGIHWVSQEDGPKPPLKIVF